MCSQTWPNTVVTLKSFATDMHAASYHSNPFAAPAGKKVKDKIAYCTRQIKVLMRWHAQTGANLFKQEAEKWQQRIYYIERKKL
jgi:hypothetical protein